MNPVSDHRWRGSLCLLIAAFLLALLCGILLRIFQRIGVLVFFVGINVDINVLVRTMICPPLSGPETMIVWTMKGTLNAEQEAQAGRDHRQAA